MLGAAVARILAIAGNSSAVPTFVLRFPCGIVGESGDFFDFGSGVPNFVICDPSPALLMPRVRNLFDVRKI